MFCADSEAELLLSSPMTAVVLSIIARAYIKIWEMSLKNTL